MIYLCNGFKENLMTYLDEECYDEVVFYLMGFVILLYL